MSQPSKLRATAGLPAAAMGAPSASVPSVPIETQAQRRRAQLVRAAAILIEAEGVDNLRMARVAKAAGCARQVVHTYFPRREDLLRAVVVEFDRLLQEELGDLDDLFMDPSTFGAASLEAWGKHVAGAAWDLIEKEGAAGLILMVSAHVSPAVTEQVEQLRRPFLERWMGYIEGVLPVRLDAEIIVELWLTMFYRLVVKWRAGELTREEGISHMIRYNVAVLQALAHSEPETI